MASPTSKHRAVLDKATLVPIGAVVSVCLALFAGWQYLDARFDTQEANMRDLSRDVRELKEEVTRDRWTRTDHRFWVSELRRLNPTLTAPPVEEER